MAPDRHPSVEIPSELCQNSHHVTPEGDCPIAGIVRAVDGGVGAVTISNPESVQVLARRKEVEDLLSRLDLPGAWRGREPEAIVRSLVDVLVRVLRLELALVQIRRGDTLVEHHFPQELDTRALIAAMRSSERWTPVHFALQRFAPPGSTQVRAFAMSPPGEIETVVVGSSRPDFPTDHELLVLEAIITQAACTIGSTREAATQRLLAEERGRLERINAMLSSLHARAEFLAEASGILFSSLEVADALTRVAQLAVPRFGDWMVIFADGRTISVHCDPARADQARERAQSMVAACGQARATAGHGMALAPIASGGRSLGALILGIDREGATVSEELLSLVERLAERCSVAVEVARRYREARDADKRKDEFLAMLGHELRHPLSPIVTALSLMKLRDPRAFERERTIMERQVAHLTRLVDDLLDVARITSGKIQLERRRVDLHGVVARAVEMTTPQFERRRHQVIIASSPEQLHVEGDATRLAQVLANLLTNAAKYTDPGGRIRVSVSGEGGQAELRVSDSGVGIAPEVLPRVFEAFVQDQESIDHAHGGLGLGLAIVQRLVEMHGGTVAAHSEGRGKGSEFVVRLPLATSATRPDAPPERAA